MLQNGAHLEMAVSPNGLEPSLFVAMLQRREAGFAGGEDEEAMKDRKVLERMVMVAFWCVQDDPSLRPSMKRVVRMMSGVVEVSVPMNPCFLSH
ncbi:G-type lectin S-receptor-like serine/threonine-protein kinase RLK1 [Cinnamomum micranthum f. kanehirae]|uniref:G-type lectin S-receptor-like serine/threonine-protein kinase RLK1 n=1 Tax=Cinnamomum micranthum f. kanehirae TaxID=337451 RepID=A0A443PZR5_9MAGN|nr:G-type lectin S-receptor-like serine/threonine-protein kinase RLK1 [Cinnamomum micranthum f. kanehirae]